MNLFKQYQSHIKSKNKNKKLKHQRSGEWGKYEEYEDSLYIF